MTIGTVSIFVGAILLILLKLFFKDEGNLDGKEEVSEIVDITEEDPWNDSGWSTLSGNLFNSDDK